MEYHVLSNRATLEIPDKQKPTVANALKCKSHRNQQHSEPNTLSSNHPQKRIPPVAIDPQKQIHPVAITLNSDRPTEANTPTTNKPSEAKTPGSKKPSEANTLS